MVVFHSAPLMCQSKSCLPEYEKYAESDLNAHPHSLINALASFDTTSTMVREDHTLSFLCFALLSIDDCHCMCAQKILYSLNV